jgi:hypothetical protein
MSESIPKEIIGIAYASEWDHIKQFIRALLELTLESEEEYTLIALNALINSKKYEEYDVQIKSKSQIELLFSITEFEKISLYQYSEYKRNIINVSKDKNVIVLTAQYMGPEIDHTNYFDFAIYLDSFNLPYFSDNKGNVFECHEIMEVIRGLKPKTPKKVKKRKPTLKLETFKSEAEIYERLTTKNATWGGNETRAYQKWKMRVQKEFREKSGGFPYYKGKMTKKYELYLNSLSKKAPPKKSKAKKPAVSKAITKKPAVSKTITKKPAVSKTITKKPAASKTVTKKPTVSKVITKKPTKKQKPPTKKLESLNLEAKIYERITGKKAIYGGRITKTFENWKLKMHKDFQQKISGIPYYRGNLTQKYKKYLNSLFNSSPSEMSLIVENSIASFS